jgi:lysophospholipase L1-like esterase
MSECRQLLMVGNSVSLSPSDGVPAYPSLVEAALNGSWRVSTLVRSGATVEEIEPEVTAWLGNSRLEALVVQVGINDCAPRPLSRSQRRLLGEMRPQWLRQRIIGMLHRWRPYIIRVRPLAQFTPLDRFGASVGRIVACARGVGAAVLVLPITRVTHVAEQRTPHTNREVSRYNGALHAMAQERVTCVDETTLLRGLTPMEFCVTPDTVHLSGRAHQRVADFIVQWLATV